MKLQNDVWPAMIVFAVRTHWYLVQTAANVASEAERAAFMQTIIEL